MYNKCCHLLKMVGNHDGQYESIDTYEAQYTIRITLRTHQTVHGYEWGVHKSIICLFVERKTFSASLYSEQWHVVMFWHSLHLPWYYLKLVFSPWLFFRPSTGVRSASSPNLGPLLSNALWHASWNDLWLLCEDQCWLNGRPLVQ